MNFTQAFKIICTEEGGYVNDPKDKGGETYKGISRKNWGRWLGWLIIDQYKAINKINQLSSPNEIKAFNSELAEDNTLQQDVQQFYFDNFWYPMQLTGINNDFLKLQLFDFGVNGGSRTAIKMIQNIVKIKDDGFNGPLTLTAINNYKPQSDLNSLFDIAKKNRYDEIVKNDPSQHKYYDGWMERMNTLRTKFDNI
jgi:lysozyme family protein